MTGDPYAGFAERYDLFGRFGEHDPQVVRFFREMFERHDVRSVLDCACGTGRDLHLFNALNLEVVGSDISEAMLTRAKMNLDGAHVIVSLHRVDYRQLPQSFDREFDAVTCLRSSILHMPDEGEVIRAFGSMREVLRKGGIMVLTQGTTDKQWKERPRFILAVSAKDVSRLFAIDYSDGGARYNILDVFHGDETPGLKVWSIDYPQILLKDDYERLLRVSGFEAVDFYGSYNLDSYDKETSDQLIVVARK